MVDSGHYVAEVLPFRSEDAKKCTHMQVTLDLAEQVMDDEFVSVRVGNATLAYDKTTLRRMLLYAEDETKPLHEASTNARFTQDQIELIRTFPVPEFVRDALDQAKTLRQKEAELAELQCQSELQRSQYSDWMVAVLDAVSEQDTDTLFLLLGDAGNVMKPAHWMDVMLLHARIVLCNTGTGSSSAASVITQTLTLHLLTHQLEWINTDTGKRLVQGLDGFVATVAEKLNRAPCHMNDSLRVVLNAISP